MVDAVVIAERSHETVAQAGLADADLALVLLRAREPNHRHVDPLYVIAFARHFSILHLF